MILHKFQNLTIKISNDQTFSFGSADNKYKYEKHYFGDGGQDYPVSKHSIEIFKDEEQINSCIVIGSAGATDVHKNSSLMDGDRILLCCSNTIFCLLLPELNLLWQTKADNATCFQIFKLDNDYLVHGELIISRIDKEGKIKWEFGGADIFVTIAGEEAFQYNSDHIILTDFCETKYKIDFNGKVISSTNENLSNSLSSNI